MVDLACSPEVIAVIAYLEARGVPSRVTSTFRPGAITGAGNPSRHGRKLAVDFAAPRPGRDTDELAAIFEAFRPISASLNELIYAGPQVTHNVKRGRWVRKYAQSIHHDHVHVAVDPGVEVASVAPKDAAPSDEVVDDSDGREDMAEPVHAICSPQGGVWVLTRDGGVRTYDATGATPFHGSYPGLPPEARQGERTFVEIKPNSRGGYDLISSGGESYSFPLTKGRARARGGPGGRDERTGERGKRAGQRRKPAVERADTPAAKRAVEPAAERAAKGAGKPAAKRAAKRAPKRADDEQA